MIKVSVSNLVHILGAHMYAFLLNWKWHVGAHERRMFNFIRNCQTHIQNGCTVLYSQQQCMRVPGGPLTQHSVLSISFDYNHLWGIHALFLI